MPQFRILIAVMLDAQEFQQASIASLEYLTAIRQRYTPGGLLKDSRVLKIEDVSPPALDVATRMPGVDTGTSTA